jgi:cell division protein FtsB
MTEDERWQADYDERKRFWAEEARRAKRLLKLARITFVVVLVTLLANAATLCIQVALLRRAIKQAQLDGRHHDGGIVAAGTANVNAREVAR